MSPEPDFAIKTGDTASSVYATLEDASGDPVDIQSATVRFKLGPIAGGTLVVAADATNAQIGAGTADGSKGDVVYNWGTLGAVPSTAGWYLGEWEVTFSNGAIQTFPNGSGYMLVEVGDDL